jgi:hypothetical protein
MELVHCPPGFCMVLHGIFARPCCRSCGTQKLYFIHLSRVMEMDKSALLDGVQRGKAGQFAILLHVEQVFSYVDYSQSYMLYHISQNLLTLKVHYMLTANMAIIRC